MSNFANLSANLNLNIQNFASNMRKASGLANQFSNNLKGQINDGLIDPAKKSKFEFKDVSRIVQGIIISKVFYSGLNAIRQCASSVWDFSQQLEYAKIAYSNLFGSTDLAEEFINVLEDFAAKTPFSFQESEAAAKRLLAYGIQYKNVMYVMQGVLAASSMQGNPQVIESVSRAIGQIYTKGRLMNEEMRQLAEAGIPAYEILRQKLGLTQKQLQNLGREGIPASQAINALIDGITERFGGVVDASSKTIKGITSNIKDNAVMLASGAFEPLTVKIKSALNALGMFLAKMRGIFELKGLGGVFEAIVPPELQGALRQFAANFILVNQAIGRLVVALLGLLKPALIAVLQVYNAFEPILITVINALAAIVGMITSNATAMKWLSAALAAAAAMWLVFKIQAVATAVVAGVVGIISKALLGLCNVLTFVVVHPIWALLLGMVGLVAGLSGGFGKLSDSVSGFFKRITAFNGINPDKVLLPSQKKRASDLDKFNKSLDGTKNSMDDLADSTGKATKAAKGLLSFDEAFKLNQPDEGTNKGTNSNTPDLGISVPDIGGSSLIPKIPSFGDFAKNFVGDLITSLKEKFIGAGIGAILGGLLGGILGGPLGAKIGAIAGAIAGWFWSDIAKALGLTDVGTVALPIATGLGAIIGAIAGGPAGALIGAAIGALVGWIIDAIAHGLETGDWSKVGLPVGIGLGAAIGFIVGGPAGAAIGAAIGGLIGWIVDMFIEGIGTGKWDFSGLSLGIGTGIGAAIGMIVGGPVGALIGAAIGALVGWIVGLIIDNWGAISQWFIDVWDAIATFFSNIGSAVGQWFVDLGTWFSTGWNSLVSSVGGFFTGIGQAFGKGLASIGAWFSGVWTTISTAVSTWLAPVSKFFTDVATGFTTFATDIMTAVGTVFTDITTAVGTVMTDIWTAITTVWTDIVTAVTTVCSTLWTVISDAFGLINDLIAKVVSDIWTAIVTWFEPIATKIGTTCSNAFTAVTTWFTSIGTAISSKVSSAASAVSTWFGSIVTVIGEKLSSACTAVTTWFGNIYTAVKTKVSDAYEAVKTFFGNMYTNVKTNIGDMYTNVKTGISNIYSAFTGWIANMWDNVFGKFFGWIDKGIKKLREFFGLDDKAKNTDTSYADATSTSSGSTPSMAGHAKGGVFNREHIARFAEGNKAEAAIPLEDAGAMQPFVDAIANGLTASLMPIVANISGGQTQMQPLYVGTLIADERSLKELQRKMQVIQIQEDTRRGH